MVKIWISTSEPIITGGLVTIMDKVFYKIAKMVPKTPGLVKLLWEVVIIRALSVYWPQIILTTMFSTTALTMSGDCGEMKLLA